jgi:hypothetical protein
VLLDSRGEAAPIDNAWRSASSDKTDVNPYLEDYFAGILLSDLEFEICKKKLDHTVILMFARAESACRRKYKICRDRVLAAK